MRNTLVLLALLGSFPETVAAQRHHHEAHDYRNEVAFFLGITTENVAEDREHYFSFGAEYEYRFLPRLGISAEVEYVTDVESAVFVLPVVFHAHRGLMFVAGPGWESSPRVLQTRGKDSSFLFRTGAQYAFHLGGRYSIIPSVDFDFIREIELELEPPNHGEVGLVERVEWARAFVWGVKFGISF